MDDSALRADRQVARNCGLRESPRGVVLADPTDVFAAETTWRSGPQDWNQQIWTAFLFWIPASTPPGVPVGPLQPFPPSICSEDNLRRITRPWTEEEIARLKRLQASGASPARAAIALKRSRQYVREKARALGVPFMTMRERRKHQASREAAERMAAGLPPEQRR
jgi:hypothetical protein